MTGRPLITFTGSNVGFYQSPSRKPGEVRRTVQEYLHPVIKRWGTATFVEDDEGFRWVDDETLVEYWTDGPPMCLTSYVYDFPWSGRTITKMVIRSRA